MAKNDHGKKKKSEDCFSYLYFESYILTIGLHHTGISQLAYFVYIH